MSKKPKYAKVGDMVEIQVPVAEDEVFLRKDLRNDPVMPVMNERHELYTFDRVEYPAEGGIHLWLKGLKYPIKGFPEPRNVEAGNRAKRILVSQMRMFARYPITAYYLLTKNGRQAWFREFNDIVYPMIDHSLLDPTKYNSLSREVFKMVPIFLEGLDVKKDLHVSIAHIFAAMIEHDDAYRYRIEDLMTVTSKEAMLKNPSREFQKILKALAERDNRVHLHFKFAAVLKILSLGFYIPKIRKAFNNAILVCDFKNMQMDEIDYYHTLRKDTYNFGGRKFEDRFAEYYQLHGGVLPESMPMN